MFFLQCLLISIFAIWASSFAPWGGYIFKYLFQRPFIGGLVIGLILGDVNRGIIIGCAMQLVYIGYFQVGGIGTFDMGIIAWPCVAVAMLSNLEIPAAIALATGLSALFSSLDVLLRNLICVAAGNLMKVGCEEGDEKKIFAGYWIIPVAMYTLMRGVGTFVMLYFGSAPLEQLVANIPLWLTSGLSAVGMFLPAVGIAALLVFLADDVWSLVIFAVGFSAYIFLGLNSLTIIFFAILMAYFFYRTLRDTDLLQKRGKAEDGTDTNLDLDFDQEVL